MLVDQQGNPVAGATVAINGPLTGTFDVKTDADGRFTFHVTGGASGLVYLHDANGRPILQSTVKDRAGQTDLKLVMPAAGQ